MVNSIHAQSSDIVVDTNLEYGIDAGDVLIYKANMMMSEYDITETESVTESTHFKFEIVSAYVQPSGTEANLTYDVSEWTNAHEFNLDERNDNALWSTPFRQENEINKSFYTIMFYENMIAIPKDIPLSYIINNRTIDTLMWIQFGQENIQAFEQAYIDTMDDEFVITPESNVIAQRDGAYGRLEYEFIVNGENETTDTAIRLRFHFALHCKYNAKYGLFEEYMFSFGMDIKSWNINSLELYELGGIAFAIDYNMIWASESKYMTADYIPYWENGKEESWWEDNMTWLIAVLITVPVVIVLTWYINSKANCDNLIDPSKSIACGSRKSKNMQK